MKKETKKDLLFFAKLVLGLLALITFDYFTNAVGIFSRDINIEERTK